MSENESKFKEGEIVRLVVTGERVQIVGQCIDADINKPMGCNSHGIAYPCRQFGFFPMNRDENTIRNSISRINLFMEYELKKDLGKYSQAVLDKLNEGDRLFSEIICRNKGKMSKNE